MQHQKHTKKSKHITLPKNSNLYLKTPNGCDIILKSSMLGEELCLFVRTNNSSANTKGFFDFYIKNQNTRSSCDEKEGFLKRQGSRNTMANVRDAANHLVRLYYYGNKNCSSAEIQKLLIIAQMRMLYHKYIPLFGDPLLVKPSCFSIINISNTYPDIIFQEDSRETLCDTYNNFDVEQVPIIDDSLPQLSSLYYIFNQLSSYEEKVIQETYSAFGKFSGKCIGEFMKNLTLHRDSNLFDEISVDSLLAYLNNIPQSDESNPIILFVKNNI